MYFLSKQDFPVLIDRLLQEYVVIAPVVRDQAVVFSEVGSWEEMALKVREESAPGSYAVGRADEGAWFRYFGGAESVKRFLHPPRQPLFGAHRSEDRAEDGVHLSEVPPDATRMAFVGLRPCDVHAVQVLDKVFLGNPPDIHYAARRKESFVLTVQCTAFGTNCFCTSVGTGPESESGYDLALTELETGFLLKTGTERGRRILSSIPHREAKAEEIAAEREKIGRVVEEMPRRFDKDTVARDLWTTDPDHPYWSEVAARCLGCTNCTMVCPTCFCYTVQDRSAGIPVAPAQHGGSGDEIARERMWDSCFSLDFAAVHGGNFRPGLRERYRHWVTHKLSTWVDQFGVLGCVGCGRCITWCPTKIDITETVRNVTGLSG